MYCENCGNELNDNQKFCPKCGTKVDFDFPTANETPEVFDYTQEIVNQNIPENTTINADTSNTNAGNNTKSNTKIIIALICVIAVVACCAVGGIYLYKHEKDANETVAAATDSDGENTITDKQEKERSLYYNYIYENAQIMDTDKFPTETVDADEEGSSGVFSALIEDFDEDEDLEMVTFSYDTSEEITLNLYEITDDTVELVSTPESINTNISGASLINACATYENNEIIIQYNLYCFGGSSHGQLYETFTVQDSTLVLKNDFSSYEFPRDDYYEYKEEVSGTVYETSEEFSSAVEEAGYDTKTHLHAGYTDSTFNPDDGDDKNDDMFKGNHIFTYINSDGFISSEGIYGFINDNTNMSTNLESYVDITETSTQETTQKVPTDSDIKNALVNYYWQNNIQTPMIYEFNDDGTFIGYYVYLFDEPKSDWEETSSGVYEISDGKVTMTTQDDYGEYISVLEYVTLDEDIEWDTGLYLEEKIETGEYFFYETDFERPEMYDDNAMYLQLNREK